jgi:myo-inositol-1(or 4)-monophosphatase
MKPRLTDLETLAFGAGKIIKDGYGRKIQIDMKGKIDLVTEIDRQSENYLVSAIRAQFPGNTVITEEQGRFEGEDNQVWYIDPLDGTVNYAHGVPIFSVSIAYVENNQVMMGAVYDPMQGELFTAERGHGSRLNGRSIQVSQANKLDQSLLVTGFPYDVHTNPENNLNHYVNFALRSRGVRRLGSAAIDLAYIAAGRFDGFWEIRIHNWDIAAGSLLVEEAGGRVTDQRGGSDFISVTPSILATNGRIHDQMLAMLNGQPVADE